MKMAANKSVEVNLTLGVDTHKDNHVAVALDGLGRHLGILSVPTTTGQATASCSDGPED